jgi:GT2 family glycosyltransferase
VTVQADIVAAVVAPAACTVSVVVCSYTEERWGDLVDAVTSVRAQTVAALEVIVVTDYCPALHDRCVNGLAGVRVVANNGNRGLSGARNTGVETARGQVVAFLDDDAVAESDWLERLLVGYLDPSVMGVGGRVVPWWSAERPGWFPPEFDWVVGCSHPGLPAERAPVRNFVGANMSFRRDVLESVGGFTPTLGRSGADASGCEETELCIRASQQHDGDLIYEPSATVRHRVPQVRASWSYFVRRCYREGRSKAEVTRLAGTRDGLSSERSYLRSTIPSGIARSIREASSGRLAGMGCALTMVVGVSATAFGYARASAAGRALPAAAAPSGAVRG